MGSQDWTYEKGTCTVTFSLNNNGGDEVDQEVRIAAHRLRDTGDEIVSELIGEKMITVRLRPFEKAILTETLELSSQTRPDMVVVTHHESRKNSGAMPDEC